MADKPLIYKQPVVRQSDSNKPTFSSAKATVPKQSQGLGASPIVRPNSAYTSTNTHLREQSADVLRERRRNIHKSAHETFSEQDAKGTTVTDQNYLQQNDKHRWKDGDTSTDSARSAQNISHHTNNQRDSQFTAGKFTSGKSSERAQDTSVNDGDSLKQRYAKSEWTGPSNQFRVENSFGIGSSSRTNNLRDAGNSDSHITDGERHADYNDVSLNIQTTDNLKHTVELLKKIKTMASEADRSLLELSALQRKDIKCDSERMKHQHEMLQKELDKVIEENKSRQIAMNEISQARDQALADLKNMKLELENERRTGTEHLTLLQQYKKEFEKIANESKNTQDELSSKKLQYDKLLQEHNQLKTENADYKTRLSQLMGSRLSDNNPDIADLSDRNRPTKLGEKYQELYDNEWTDAFEVFEGYFQKDEKRAIKNLKNVLEHVKETCDELSRDQSAKLVESLTMRTEQRGPLSKELIKQLKDLRRSIAESSLDGVLEKYIKHVEELQASDTKLATLVLDKRIRPFIKGCVQLCWLMSVQDPPLEFGTDPDSTKPIDTNIYKFYTKTGRYVDYVVWPPLYLHKEGPLLCKGILQGHTPEVKRYTPIKGDTPVVQRDATVVQAYTRQEDKSSARERRRGNFASTHTDTTHNNVSPQPRVHSNASAQRQTGHNNYKYQTGENQSGSRPEIMSSSTSNSQTNVPFDIQAPTVDELRIFYGLGRQYGLGSKEQKEALGDRYQACLEEYKYLKRNKQFFGY